MAERKLKVRNYRNVGVEEEQELLLNTSLEKGEMGSLVVVVGPNNSGKTNCLDALVAFGQKNGITSKDIPDFNNDNPSPELSFVISDESITLGLNKTLKGKAETEVYFYNDRNSKNKKEEIKSPSKAAVDFAIAIITFNVNNGQLNRIPQIFHQRARIIISTQKIDNDYDLIQSTHVANNTVWGIGYYKQYLGLSIDDKTASEYIEEFNINKNPNLINISDWEEKRKLKVLPSIIKFTETVTSHNQLTIAPDQLNSSPFFKVLFSAINYEIESLINCYKKVKEQNLNGLLRKTEKDINIKLEEVTKQFNKLFFLNDKKYRFELTLETNAVFLSIFIDEIPLHLDKQSSGFKWFFNFYFSVIAQNKLQRGDIIVLDEPATHLHMQGIQELRSFMKEYAKKSELTIVVSTHIPFFVDVNHLEEVRIVNRVGDGAVIDNKFHAIGGQETDALKPIKDALTVGRYVLYDQGNTHTIFVEGITDYCYLSAFKMLNKIDNIVFLPIQGVKKQGIVETLLKVEKLPTILVDGDEPGIKFKEKHANKKNVEIFTLADIDNRWKTIEDLFSIEDKQKTKYFNDCVSFKNRLSANRVSKETKDNFKKLLENISL